jgi:ATP-dependent Clp protease protease subunit
LIHQPFAQGDYAQASDIEIQAAEIMRIRLMQEELISRHSNKTVAEVTADVERDKILTAAEAVEYGLIDQVLESRKAKPQA